jgi:hypothetical protein
MSLSKEPEAKVLPLGLNLAVYTSPYERIGQFMRDMAYFVPEKAHYGGVE